MNKLAQSMENYEKYKNVELSIEKTTKSATTFRKNKPNSPIVQMNVSIYYTKVYNKKTAFRRAQNKPNSNPISNGSPAATSFIPATQFNENLP